MGLAWLDLWWFLPTMGLSPTRPGRLAVIPPVEVAAAVEPLLSSATAPTVSWPSVSHTADVDGVACLQSEKEVESLRKITSIVIDFWCALLFWIRKHKTWEDASSQRQGLWSRNSRTSVIITKPWRSEDEKDYINHCSQTCVHVIIIFKSQLKICLCD